MFGSNFFANFGIPDPAFQGVDAAGGLFGPTVNPNPAAVDPPSTGQPAAGLPMGPQPPALGSPLGGGPLGPGVPPSAATPGAIHTSDNTIEKTAPPAAGLNSPFGRPNL